MGLTCLFRTASKILAMETFEKGSPGDLRGICWASEPQLVDVSLSLLVATKVGPV